MDARPEPTAEQLRQRWPLAFNDNRPPLQVGIHNALQLPYGILALRLWVGHPVYLRNLIAGQPRVGPDGVVCGTPTNAERERAWRVLMFLRCRLAGQEKYYGLTTREVLRERNLRIPKGDKGWVWP